MNLAGSPASAAGMRWIVCGGRRERLRPIDLAVLAAIHRPDLHPWLGGLFRRLQALEPRLRPRITAVYAGCAPGVDADALAAAKELGIPWKKFTADWDQYGNGAGPRRNTDMLNGLHRHGLVDKPEAVLAMPGGDGTADTVRKARTMGILVVNLADPLVTAALASYQRWTKHDAWLLRSDRKRCLEVQQTRAGIGPPIVSGHWMKVNGKVLLPAWCLYVGRDAHGVPAHPRLHNPFPVKPLADGRYLVHLPDGPREADAAGALGFYRDHLASHLPQLRAELAAIVLQRRVLVCWCGESKPCHACVIAEFAVDIVAARSFVLACEAGRASTAAPASGTAPA